MLKGKGTKSGEKIFSNLPEFGYSEKTAYLIWLWYHPTAKCSTDVLDPKV
jgi:hypothetical protein